MAAARVARKRQLGYALKRRIAALDPEEDHEEVARLTLEVLYGEPIAVHASYLIGFSRQVAVPSLARVIYRGGGGDNLRDVARRTDDTLALFGAFLKWAHRAKRDGPRLHEWSASTTGSRSATSRSATPWPR